jgi:3-hydroxyisobutyrate dehydrogenase-like beta-hydroxyacid dehydrogenase
VTSQQHIAFLGLGQMGAPIARLLFINGHDVTLWNRSRDKAESVLPVQTTISTLERLGMKVPATVATHHRHIASSPHEAVAHADIVFTMLSDDAATEAVLFGDSDHPGFIDTLPRDAVHVTLSTISVALARRITAAHQERGQHHIGAPVFGRPAVAEAGRLWIVASGEDAPLARVRPLLESVSRGLTIVSSEPWQAHALKLGGNLMISSMIQTLSEAFVYAESQGIPLALFHQAINNALFQSQLYENYGKTILNPPEHPGATVMLGIKDTRLAREAAAAAGVHMRLAEYFAEVLDRAAEAGFANEDWAVGQYRIAQSDAPLDAAKD